MIPRVTHTQWVDSGGWLDPKRPETASNIQDAKSLEQEAPASLECKLKCDLSINSEQSIKPFP